MAKILIVDDDDITRNILKAILEDVGHQTIEASDGDEGITMAREHLPDLILLDLNMPRMTGLEVAPILRTHPATRGVLVIALTADESTQGREMAHDAGCDFFLNKPISADRLTKAVSRALLSKKSQKPLLQQPEKKKLTRVLIVDDDDVIRSLLTMIAQDIGGQVVGEATNGIEALDAFRRIRPDLTLLDIDMPKTDGLSALREIQNIDPSSIVVMLSGTDDTAIAESCLYLGARNFIAKSDGAQKIRESLKAVMGY